MICVYSLYQKLHRNAVDISYLILYVVVIEAMYVAII